MVNRHYEHITIESYHQFVGRGTVATFRAKITVHQGDALIAESNVSTNLGGDDCWNVFAIKDELLIDKTC